MQALGGVRVIDMSIDVAGAYCGKLLADYGAEVIKVEDPRRGDPLRYVDPASDSSFSEKSALFLHLNANKHGITLDVRVFDRTGTVQRTGAGVRRCHRELQSRTDAGTGLGLRNPCSVKGIFGDDLYQSLRA